MRRIRKYSASFLFAGIIVLFYFCISYAENKTEESKPQEPQVRERYDEIKKKQNKDYKTGVYNDNKKDYVKNWINEDINYHKRVIKLKSDYLSWAKEQISKKEEVNFYDYESLNNLTDAEKKILLEYHNSLFGNKKDKKSNLTKNVNISKNKKVKQVKTEDKRENRLEQKDISIKDESTAKESENFSSMYSFLFLGIFSIIAVAFAFIYFRKK